MFVFCIKLFTYLTTCLLTLYADRKLCKELCRLPILWMNPSDRTVEKIHGYLSEILGIQIQAKFTIDNLIKSNS